MAALKEANVCVCCDLQEAVPMLDNWCLCSVFLAAKLHLAYLFYTLLPSAEQVDSRGSLVFGRFLPLILTLTFHRDTTS